jgi:hypothetical protein
MLVFMMFSLWLQSILRRLWLPGSGPVPADGGEMAAKPVEGLLLPYLISLRRGWILLFFVVHVIDLPCCARF